MTVLFTAQCYVSAMEILQSRHVTQIQRVKWSNFIALFAAR